MTRIILLLAAASLVRCQTADPAYAPLQKAYDAVRSKDYDRAIVNFRQALALAPDRAQVHTDLAYVLLKIGENQEARDQFGEAARLNPADDHVALEYAFLCYETQQRITARRIFDRLRKSGNGTAAAAFENIDRPLREGIERWKIALAASPANFSGHEELAKLAEDRDETALAAEHYEKAWRLRPARRDLLLDLGRVWKQLGRDQDANAALLAASRGAEPRVAEEARVLLPVRYPFVYEFDRALALDPENAALRRELAFLDLQMGANAEAEREFEKIVHDVPADRLSMAQLGFLRLARGDKTGAMPLLQQVLAGGDDELADRVRTALRVPQKLQGRTEVPRAAVSNEAKELAEKSLDKGYLPDAIKYLIVAHENDPLDFSVMLKLGWTYNMLKDDANAVRWFDLARRSPDPKIAAEAKRAYQNLEPEQERIRTAIWAYPVFSTRWHDLFGYAQAKVELHLPRWWVHPYLSARLVGDSRGEVEFAGLGPQYLSERSIILGAGVATNSWRGLTGWFEAGESLRFSPTVYDPGRDVPDYRGGLAFAKGLGHLLTNGSHGLFAETSDDGVYASRFDKDMLIYSQNRTGYTLRSAETLAGFHAQVLWNWNATVDQKRQYWANYVETGPGVRFRFEGLPAAMTFSVSALRGAYLINQGNPRGPNYYDLRISLWYAFSR